MKLFLSLFICLLILSCSVSNRNSIETTTIISQQDLNLKEIIVSTTDSFPTNTQLSIALVKNNEVNFLGYSKAEKKSEFVENHDKVFEIGSISKVFTATMLSNLVSSNKLDLDSEIQKLLNIDFSDGHDITLRHLANHTSGLPRLPSNLNLYATNPNNPYEKYSDSLLVEYLIDHVSLSGTPGINYDYSNLGAGLLGYTMSKSTDLSYEQLLQDYICSKYDMTSTTSDRVKIQSRLVKGLDVRGDETSNWDMNVLVGAGGILSSVQDLSKFVLAQMRNNKELEFSHVPTFTVSDNMSIGLGWHIIKSKDGENWLWHNGGTGGYTSSMTIDKGANAAVVILSNVSAFHKDSRSIDDLCFDLLDAINKK